MNEKAIRIKGLVKRYGTFTAVDQIDIEVEEGEVFGLLGPNGAGKTTTLECLEGIRKADSGEIDVAGFDPQKEDRSLTKKLGVQLQSSSLPEDILVNEAIKLVCAFGKIEVNKELIDRFEIEDLLKKRYGELSTGQKRRVHLVLALVNDPKVVILDEPTAGLDVQSRAKLHEEIRKIKTKGVTVLLATHDMAEAEALCDRIAILIGGKIAICDTPEKVTASGNKETRVRLRTAKDLIPEENINGAVFVSKKDGYLEWKCKDVADSVFAILKKVQELSDTIEDLRVERPSLEERFLELIEGDENK